MHRKMSVYILTRPLTRWARSSCPRLMVLGRLRLRLIAGEREDFPSS